MAWKTTLRRGLRWCRFFGQCVKVIRRITRATIMAKRRRFTAGFKARVALEALREDKTVQAIATRHQVHPNQVSQWKRKAREGLVAVFERG